MAGCCLHPTFCVSMDSRSHGCSTLLRCPHRCAALRSTAGRNSPRKVCTARQQLVAAVAGPPVQTLSACCVPCTAAAHGACDLLSVGQRDGVRLHFASSLLKGRPRLAPTATDCLEQLLRLRASLLRTAKLSKLQQPRPRLRKNPKFTGRRGSGYLVYIRASPAKKRVKCR